MRLRKLILFCVVFLLLLHSARADKYPKNPDIDILHYSFDLTLSDDTDEIFGITTITLRFKKEGIDKVRLDLINQSVQSQGKGMIVESAYQGETKISFKHVNNELWLTLAKLSIANSEIQVTIKYHGTPADGLRIGPTRYGDRSFFNENWPHRARHWLPTVDHPYEKATSEFVIKAPSHYQVVSNGLLMEETNLDAKTKLTHWKQLVPVSSWLYVLGVAEFAVQYVDQFQGKSIQTWVYAKDRNAGFHDFAEPTKQAVTFFSDYVGPYVYEKIANVQTPSVHGGMETSSAIFYGEDLVDGKRTNRLRNIVIHELAHQWFGNAVTESDWDDAWLSEGFATYFTMLFIEQAYGREEFVDQLLSARKTTYDYYINEPSYKIIDDRSPEIAPVTSKVTYQKGAWVLHMLRNFVGDKAFNLGIRDYYQKHMNANATTSDFRLAMEAASGKDLKKFFDQWLYQGGNIALKGTWRYDKSAKLIKISLQQTQAKDYKFDFPIEIGLFKAGSVAPEISTHAFDKLNLQLVIPSEVKPDKIVLDPRTVLLADWNFSEVK